MSAYTQEMRPIAVETPLGKDVLLLTAFSGNEDISRLFQYDLEFQSEKKTIKDKDIVGKNITFWVEFPDGSPRYFNGIVQRFAYAGTGDRMSVYRASVVPWFWLLTRTTDCRIFQDKSVPDIIKEVIGEAGFAADLEPNLSGPHPKWDYCVQYRESDFNFLTRLMEIEGIFYYFKHEKGKHTLVLGDSKSAYASGPDSSVQFLANISQPEDTDQIKAWEHQYEYRSGKWAFTDYNFETPSTSLLVQTNSRIGLPTADKFELFDYPGEYEKKSEGTDDIKLRMEEEEAGYDVVIGESVCRGFNPGFKFKLDKHHNSAEEGKGYVVTGVRHQARVGSTYVGGETASDIYRNSFTCIPDSVTYRPPRTTRKPLIHGLQTAVVTGPPGDEIHLDKYGRVKVQFHWDRLGKKDDKTTCYIRVMQPSAGKGWGTMMFPRIGQEVVVAYLEGDPDRPLITGVVYNAGQMPAYDPSSDHKTKWGMKSNSSPGGNGFNELRFDDKAGKEQIFLHAQYDMDSKVLHDSRETISGNVHTTIGGNNYEKIGGNRDAQLGGNLQETVKGNVLYAVNGNEDQTYLANLKQKVVGNHDTTISGNRNQQVTGTYSLTGSADLLQKLGSNFAVDAGMSVHIKAGMTLILEAGMQLSLKVGGNFVDLSPAGVAINGMPMVMINSGGAAGSGAGCSPTAPQAPETPEPHDPAEADKTAKTGQKSCP